MTALSKLRVLSPYVARATGSESSLSCRMLSRGMMTMTTASQLQWTQLQACRRSSTSFSLALRRRMCMTAMEDGSHRGDGGSADRSRETEGGLVSPRVFVGNLPFDATEHDVSPVMSEVGDVVSVRILRRQDGRSAGAAIVEFESLQAANAAVAQLQDRELLGRKMFIRQDRENPRDRSGAGSGPNIELNKTVSINNLAEDESWQSLKDIGREYGRVKFANVAEPDERGRRSGYIQFFFAEDAHRCCNAMAGKATEDGGVLEATVGGSSWEPKQSLQDFAASAVPEAPASSLSPNDFMADKGSRNEA